MSTDAKRELSNAEFIAWCHTQSWGQCNDVRDMLGEALDRLEAAGAENAELRLRLDYAIEMQKRRLEMALGENTKLRAKVAELEAETARLRDMAAVAFCAGRDA